jgi:hypothetical protein
MKEFDNEFNNENLEELDDSVKTNNEGQNNNKKKKKNKKSSNKKISLNKIIDYFKKLGIKKTIGILFISILIVLMLFSKFSSMFSNNENHKTISSKNEKNIFLNETNSSNNAKQNTNEKYKENIKTPQEKYTEDIEKAYKVGEFQKKIEELEAKFSEIKSILKIKNEIEKN